MCTGKSKKYKRGVVILIKLMGEFLQSCTFLFALCTGKVRKGAGALSEEI